MEVKVVVFCIILNLAFLPFLTNSWPQNEDCTYVIYVKTGEKHNAGTLAKVNLEVRDIYFNNVNITNLEHHGVVGKRHDYFKRGNLGAFSVKSKCLQGPLCSMTLSHDNSGFAPGWYVDFVDVTFINPLNGCQKLKFLVNGWLAVDEPPNHSTRWGVYLCDEVVGYGSKCSLEN